MKKLMITAAVVCAAAMVQAAACSWSTTGKAYGLKAADLAAGLSANTTYNAGTASTEYMSAQNAGWTYSILLTDTTAAAEAKELTGSINKYSLGKISGVQLVDDYIVAGHDYTYTLVMSGTIADGKSANWDVTSNTISGSFHAQDTGDIKFSSASASTWSTAAVPEPTSGLLLILGVAGLALRRRRA